MKLKAIRGDWKLSVAAIALNFGITAFMAVLIFVGNLEFATATSALLGMLLMTKIFLYSLVVEPMNISDKFQAADTLLIFFCKPDEAECLAGDLIEEYEKVAARKPRWVANVWFVWELSILITTKARNRLMKAVVPKKLFDLLSKRSG